MRICSLASGSSGNVVYVGSETTHILIDAGVSFKRIKEGLSQIGVEPLDINAVFITHEHSDHISGLGVLSRKIQAPIHSKEKTLHEIKRVKSLGVIEEDLWQPIVEDASILIGDIVVTPFKSTHDAIDPLCYTFENKGKKISVATDLGNYNEYIFNHLSGSNVLYIEANHDIRMLEVGPYPFFLKQRILSDLGHLSNELSAKLICELYHDEMSDVILAHLSHENNMPDVAYASVKYAIDQTLKLDEATLMVHVAKRSTNSTLVEI